jgi:hypothetical protein
MMFRLPGVYPHAELLDEAERVRKVAEAGSRRRRRTLDRLEADQDSMKSDVLELTKRVLHPTEPPSQEVS